MENTLEIGKKYYHERLKFTVKLLELQRGGYAVVEDRAGNHINTLAIHLKLVSEE